MQLPESLVAENLDEIIQRSAVRLEQERVHVAELSQNNSQRTSAKAALIKGMQALKKLKAYRARFDKVER